MKKLILSTSFVVSFGFYVVWQNMGNSVVNFTASAPVVATNITKNTPKHVAIIPTTPVLNNPLSNSMINNGGMTNGGMMNRGIFRDGEYVGSVADAYYGYVQVKAVITNGRLTDVVFLDYPKDRSTSIRINSRAMPILRQEAIAAQSAKVDGVSGASATSPAFIESLTSALNQAKV